MRGQRCWSARRTASTAITSATHKCIGAARKWRTGREKRDPIKHLAAHMKEAGSLTDAEDEAIQQRVAVEIQEAVRFAESSPYPTPDELHKDIYSYEYA